VTTPTFPNPRFLYYNFSMKRLLPVLMGFVFLLLSSAEGWSAEPDKNYLNEEKKENTWIVIVNEKRGTVVTSVNGKTTHGDRLRIRFLKGECNVGNTITTVYTIKNNPNILDIRDIVTSAIFKGVRIKVKILFAQKFLSGHVATVDLGWNKIESIKNYFFGKSDVSLVLKDDKNFKPSAYFDLIQNTWSLNGLEIGLDRARRECRRLP
jgi:hypothetical protein